MRIKESSLNDVKSKLSALKRSRTEDSAKEEAFRGKTADEAYELRRKLHEDQRREKKRQKREKKKLAKQGIESNSLSTSATGNSSSEQDDIAAKVVDNEKNDEELQMMKIMGFGGFK